MDLGAYAIDGRVPSRVERATATADVGRVLGGAHAGREAVVLWGGATRIGVGDAPSRYDVALDLRGLDGVVEHSPADLVCTVRAGTTVGALAGALAPSRQGWPVEVADAGRATVGGTIASAAAGPSRLRHQHPRDWVIGCEAVLADGTVTRAGGRVVKNVTGYDLSRLYSGTFGTLVAITEVTLKLVALPESVRAFRVVGAGDELRALATALHAARLPLDALVLDVSPGTSVLLARAAGPAAATERIAAELRRRAPFAEADPAEIARVHDRSVREALVLRLALPLGREVESVGGIGRATVHVGSGVAFAYDPPGAEPVGALRRRIEAIGGALVVERAAPELRAAIGAWGTLRTHPAVAARLKERFDPHGVLAPGRM